MAPGHQGGHGELKVELVWCAHIHHVRLLLLEELAKIAVSPPAEADRLDEIRRSGTATRIAAAKKRHDLAAAVMVPQVSRAISTYLGTILTTVHNLLCDCHNIIVLFLKDLSSNSDVIRTVR